MSGARHAVAVWFIVLLFATLAASIAGGQGPPDIAWVAKGASVWKVAVSPDGQTLVTAGYGELQLKMWRIDGTYIRTFAEEGGTEFWSLAFSPDGRYVVAGRSGVAGDTAATAMIYRVSDGVLVRGLNEGEGPNFDLVGSVDWSPAGNLVAVAYDNYSLGIWLYNPTTGALVRTIPEGGYGVKFSPDGQTIVAATLNGPKIWRVSDGAVLHTLPTSGGSLFSFSSDGQFVAVAWKPGPADVKIFRTGDGGLERAITPATAVSTWSIAFAPNQDLLVIAGDREAAIDIGGPVSDETIDAYHVNGQLAWSYYHSYGSAMDLSFTPDGQSFIVGGGWVTPPNYVENGTDRVQRIRTSDGAELAHFAAGRGLSYDVAFSPDNRFFASAGNFPMQVWNVADGSVAHTFTHGSGSVDFSGDSTKLVAVVGTPIGIWNVPGFDLFRVLPGHNNGTQDAVFSPDGAMVLSGGFDNNAKLWRVSDGALLWTRAANTTVDCVAFSPDGQLCAAGSRGSQVRIWRADGTFVRNLTGRWAVTSIAFSPDSTMLAVAENTYFDQLKLYRMSDGALIHVFPGPYGSQFNDVAWTPDGLTLVLSTGGRFIQLWRVSDGALLRHYDKETGTGYFPWLPVAVSADGRFIGYGRQDHMVVMAHNPIDPAPNPTCDSADFNCDGDVATDADIEAFFACIAGVCPRPPCANSSDFNHDGQYGTDADIEAFFRVLAGQPCGP